MYRLRLARVAVVLMGVCLLASTLVRGDSIDDAEAKKRGISAEQVRLERKVETLTKTLAQRDNEIAALKAQLSASAGGGASTKEAATLPATGKEAWISKPAAQWPQIHLKNEVKLTGNRSMNGASASLIKLDDGRLLAVTARHLIGPDGGIDPAIPLAQLDSSIQSWILSTYAAAQPQIRLGKLATKLEDEGLHDCLIFNAAEIGKLPGLALRPRTEPLKEGDKLYLLGCPYDQTPYRQNAYGGSVIGINEGGKNDGTIDFKLEAQVVTRGFSGAPVIDENGHFAGIFLGHLTQQSGTGYDVRMMSAQTVLSLIPGKK
jgi:hypothetical protein